MNWQVELAKNGQFTLKVNDKYYYSKYRPVEDAEKFVLSNVNADVDCYILLGLGLGYHLQILKKVVPSSKIFVLLIEEEEIKIFNEYGNPKLLQNVTLLTVQQLVELNNLENAQFLIPISILNCLPENHILKTDLDTFKLNEMNYKLYEERLRQNFYENIRRYDSLVKKLRGIFKGQTACLVSSGPSIDRIIPVLQQYQHQVFILAVSSALRILEVHNIKPHAVVLSDSKIKTKRQFENLQYNGPLFYLATSTQDVIKEYSGIKYILFQEGYPLSVEQATKLNEPLFDVGGSVATLAFSLLEFLGFNRVILCGQDLGFREGKTHSIYTTSGMAVSNQYRYQTIEANNGEMIYTSKSLKSYHRWFENKIQKSSVQVFNTALYGAKIKGATYITEDQMTRLIIENDIAQLQESLEVFNV